MFTLPKVSARLKLKLTALEGSRVRRVSAARFGSCRAEDYGEHHLAVLTNLGDVQVVSLPLLKPQVRYSCIRREDVSGIASCVFTKYGQGVWGAGPAGPPPPGPGLGLPLRRGGCWEGQPGVFRPKPGSSGRELLEALIPNDPPVWGLGVGSAVLLAAAGPTWAALTCQPSPPHPQVST